MILHAEPSFLAIYYISEWQLNREKLSYVKNKYTLIVQSPDCTITRILMHKRYTNLVYTPQLKVHKKLLINTIFLVLFLSPNTVDPHLSGLLDRITQTGNDCSIRMFC